MFYTSHLTAQSPLVSTAVTLRNCAFVGFALLLISPMLHTGVCFRCQWQYVVTAVDSLNKNASVCLSAWLPACLSVPQEAIQNLFSFMSVLRAILQEHSCAYSMEE